MAIVHKLLPFIYITIGLAALFVLLRWLDCFVGRCGGVPLW